MAWHVMACDIRDEMRWYLARHDIYTVYIPGSYISAVVGGGSGFKKKKVRVLSACQIDMRTRVFFLAS